MGAPRPHDGPGLAASLLLLEGPRQIHRAQSRSGFGCVASSARSQLHSLDASIGPGLAASLLLLEDVQRSPLCPGSPGLAASLLLLEG